MSKKFNLTFLIFVFVFIENERNQIFGADVTSRNDATHSTPFLKEQFCNSTNFYQSYQCCSCHKECSTLNETCCSDHKYCNRPNEEDLVCTETPLHGFIYMKNTCLPNYPYNNTVVHHCLTTNKTSLLKNYLLLLPVTTSKKITYKNLFCAICNNEASYVIWNLALRYEIESQRQQNVVLDIFRSFFIQPSTNPYAILSDLTADVRRMKLISRFDDVLYRWEVLAYLPSDMTGSVQHCGPSALTRKCSICEQHGDNGCVDSISFDNMIPLQLRNHFLPIRPNKFYKYIFENPHGKFHFDDTSSSKDTCYPEDIKGACLNNTYLEKEKEFLYVDNETIIILKDNTTRGSNDWSHTLANNSIYFCGRSAEKPQQEPSLLEIINEFNTTILDLLSVLFLFLLLIIISIDGKKKLKGLAYKVTFSTCFTEFLLYVLYNLRKLFNFSMIWNIILHHLCLSYFAWLLVAAYNLWEVICYSTAKFEAVGKMPYFKKYLLYCFFGWGLPLLVVLVSAVFEYLPIDKIPCEYKPTYGNGIDDNFINQKIPFYYFFFLPITVMTFMVSILFGYTFYYIFAMERRGVKLSNQKHYLKFYVKLAFAMGATWMIYFLLSIYDDNLFVKTIGAFFDASQGIFMFFAYGFERKIVFIIYEKLTSSMSFSSASS